MHITDRADRIVAITCLALYISAIILGVVAGL